MKPIEMTSELTEVLPGKLTNLIRPDQIESVIKANRKQWPSYFDSGNIIWQDTSLGSGLAGLLLLAVELEVTNTLPEDFSHPLVLALKASIEMHGINNHSLFNGTAGLCFAIQSASRSNTRYQRLLTTLKQFLIDGVRTTFLKIINTRLTQQLPSVSRTVDVIAGLSGIGRYLIDNLSDPLCYDCLVEVLQCLLALIQPRTIEGQILPGWVYGVDDPLNQYRGKTGFWYDMGLAHGVTGILNLLTTSYARGIRVNGLRSTIYLLTEWILSKAERHAGGPSFPSNILAMPEQVKSTNSDAIHRSAWCYGTPGVARTLFLTGQALDDAGLSQQAFGIFFDVIQQPVSQWGLVGPMLCHGLGSMLLINEFMIQDAPPGELCTELQIKQQTLHRLIWSQFDKNSPFGFQNQIQVDDESYLQINDPSYLTGAAGLFLSLLFGSNSMTNYAMPMMVTL